MSRFSACPNCDREASGGPFGGAYIQLHHCQNCGDWMCEGCRKGDACPNCGSEDIDCNEEDAYPSE